MGRGVKAGPEWWDDLLIDGRAGGYGQPGRIVLVPGVAAVLLIRTGLLPDVVARAIGTPYVSRGQLRFPAARPGVIVRLVKLNPDASIQTQ